MKKSTLFYLILIILIIGLAYYIPKIQYQEQIKKAEIQIELQKKLTNQLKEIHTNFNELNDDSNNKPYFNSLISQSLVEIQELTTNSDTSAFSIAKKTIVNDYIAYQNLKLEHARLQKLVAFYENDYIPCSVQNINFSYLMNAMHNGTKVTQKDLKKYKTIEPIKVFHSGLKGDSCFRISSKLYDNGELEISENNCKESNKTIHYRKI